MELKYIYLFDLMTLKLFDLMYVPYGFYFKCLNCRAYNNTNNYCVIDLTNFSRRREFVSYGVSFVKICFINYCIIL